MINDRRIVPVTRTDLLSLYSSMIVMALPDNEVQKIDAIDIDGTFDIGDTGEIILVASQPVVKVTFDGAYDVKLYFVADAKYEGFDKNGNIIETQGDEVIADGSLYKGTITGNNSVIITKIGF